MSWLPWVLFGLAAVLLLARAYVAFWTRHFRVPREPDEIHFARTADGWRLALGRYLPQNPVAGHEPVILCHGLGANAYNVDFDERLSLARWLARRGWDAWVLELRGIGWSRRPPADRPRAGWSFDDLVRLDVAAAVALVREKSGAEKVHWVGHSMGGMVMYAFLQGPGAEQIRSVVAIGSPVRFVRRGLLRVGIALLGLIRLLGRVPQRAPARFIAPFGGWVRFPGSGAVTAPGSMEGAVLRRALANLPEDLPYGVLAQFADWARSGDFRDAAGTTSWRDGLAAVRTPMLFVAGSRDLLAAPDAVRPAYERLGSADKELRLVGKEHGQAGEYGHGDLLVGRRAPEEVFPLVLDWLERHT